MMGMITLSEPQIRWNCERSTAEKHFDNPRLIYSFFIRYRNPKNLLDKIVGQFNDAKISLEENCPPISGPDKNGTVNEYLFVSYLTNQRLDSLKFDFTDLPHVKDPNMSANYKKDGKLEDYVLKIIG